MHKIQFLRSFKTILRYCHWIIFKQMNIISKMQNNMFAENAFGIEVKVSREMANASLIEFIPANMKIDASTLHDDELY